MISEQFAEPDLLTINTTVDNAFSIEVLSAGYVFGMFFTTSHY